MRGRTRCAALFGAAFLLGAGAAGAHDPDWKPSDEAPKPTPAPAEPAGPEGEKWPDPFAAERKWGPIHLGVAAGYFLPWQGNRGPVLTAHGLISSPSGHVRLGGEFLYRSYESRVFDVSDVDLDSYEVNFVFHWLFNPEGISPYLGFVTGFQINKLRKTEIEGERPNVDIEDDVGAGWGLAAVAGVEIPIGDHLAVYGEARAGLAYQQTSSDDDDHYKYEGDDDYDHYSTEDLGGGTGVLGVRFRF